MSRLLVFTENYRVPPGVASYLVDLSNSVGDLFDDLVLASNPDGLAPDTSSRIIAPHTVEQVQIVTADRVGVAVNDATWLPWRGQIACWLVRLTQRLDRLVFGLNVAVCRRAIRGSKATAVLSFNGGYPAGRSVLAMAVAARRERLPVALCVVSVPTDRPHGPLGAWETRMDALVGDAADIVVVNAAAIGMALVEQRGLSAGKIRVIHNALPDRAQSVPAPAGGRFRIGCVARMEAMKGIRYLVEAFADVSAAVPGLELMLVGDGPDRVAIRGLVTELGLQESVLMTGYYDGDVAELVATFDVYAFPSLWEGLPYALLEAMRESRAIVATDVGGVPEAIIDGETGLLVRPESAEDLSAAMRRLIEDAGLRGRLGASARVKFEEEFSLAAMQERTAAVFTEAGLT